MADQFPKLIVLTGPEEGSEFVLAGKETILIGRTDENDFIFTDTSVSRRHVTLVYKDNKWLARDESSRNGTFINETKLEGTKELPLNNLDVLHVGIYDLRFVEKEVSDAEIKQQISYKKSPEEPKADATDQIEKGLENFAPTEEVSHEDEEQTERSVISDQDDIEEAGLKGEPQPYPAPKLGKGLKVFVVIALVFSLLGLLIHFSYEHFQKEKDQEDVLVQDETKEQEDQGRDGEKGGEGDIVDKDVAQGKMQLKSDIDKEGQQKDKTKQDAPVGKVVTPGIEQVTSPDREIKVFLDIKTEPLPATIFLKEKRLGLAPFKQNISVKPNQTYALYADFELREINDIYRKKVEFKVKPDTDVVELKVDGEIGVLKILKLPRRVEFYLEGYYEYDKLRANPIKITDIIYGKPIYLPYGKYIVELREKTKIAGSDNLITQIRFQREYNVNKDNRILSLKVTDRDLQFFPAMINSNPSHADVYYGGEKMGTTPYSGKLPLGTNKLKIVKDGFFASVIDIDMRMNSIYEVTVDLKTSKIGELINKAKELLRNDQGDEAINVLVEALKYGGSAKEKAEVYFLLGSVYLSRKDYDSAKPYFEKSRSHPDFYHRSALGITRIYHYKKESAKALKLIVEVLVNIDKDTPTQIRSQANNVFKLISPVKSVMYIYTDPSGAHVFVNDKRIQQDSPLILSDLGLGNYRLQLEKAGYQTYKTKQNLKIGEFVMIRVKLTPEKI